MMTPFDISVIRLHNQQITDSRVKSPAALVRYMGAMQAQNYNMVKYAVGLRLPGATKQQVEKALNAAKIVRTHVLRPTWHLASPEDLGRMLQISAPRILASQKNRHRQLGLTPEVLKKCFKVLNQSLEGHPGKRRQELLEDLEKAGITTAGDNRSAHILMAAELNQIICSGKESGKQNTYALYPSSISGDRNQNKEGLMAWLAEKYFTGHGPATIEDFAWWSGQTLTDSKKAVANLSGKLETFKMREKEYWMPKQTGDVRPEKDNTCLVPAFDELVVAYKDRSAIFTPEDSAKAISSNGIFWPVILLNGRVSGLWKMSSKGKALRIETSLFRRHTTKEKMLIKDAAHRMSVFYGKEVAVVF